MSLVLSGQLIHPMVPVSNSGRAQLTLFIIIRQFIIQDPSPPPPPPTHQSENIHRASPPPQLCPMFVTVLYTVTRCSKNFAPLAACQSACLLPTTPTCDGTHWILTLSPNNDNGPHSSLQRSMRDRGPFEPTNLCLFHFSHFPFSPRYTNSESLTMCDDSPRSPCGQRPKSSTELSLRDRLSLTHRHR